MKQLIRLLFVLPVLLLTSCSKEEMAEDTQGVQGNITFTIDFAPQTRVGTDADFTSDWEANDRISLFAVAHDGTGGTLAASGNYIHNVVLTYNHANGTWIPSEPLWWPGSGKVLSFYAFHPHLGISGLDPTIISFGVLTDQNRTVGGISYYNQCDLITAKSDNAGNGWGKGSTVPLTFNHALAMVQVTLDNSADAIDTNYDVIVKLRGVKTATTINLANISAAAGSEVTLYAPQEATDITMHRVADAAGYVFRALVPAQTIETGASLFTITNGDNLFTGGVLTQALVMKGGQAETFTVTLPTVPSKQPEANSYMLVPGGRAILIPVSRANKATNPAYNLGAVSTDLGGVTAGNYTVELVWSDAPVGANGVIKTMYAYQSGSEGHIYVEPGIAGNAVICIKVGGIVKWSWHIWVTQAVTQATDVVTGLTWMDRNLGAAGTTYDANGRNGLFYQWGRKDAFPASDGAEYPNMKNQTYYTAGGPAGTTAAFATGSYTELPDLVQNPFVFAANHTIYCGSLNSVGIENDSWGEITIAKTIYDPCPSGWKVPPVSAGGVNSWGTFGSAEWNLTNFTASKGALFNGFQGVSALNHFYPAAGIRSGSSGGISNVGGYGNYWSASGSSSNNLAYRLHFYSTGALPALDIYRASGLSVRCVRE